MTGAALASHGSFLATEGKAYSEPRRVDAWHRIEAFPKPLVAAVNGLALGGGFELMMLCEIAIAADTARFGAPEINVASFPGDGGTQRLSRLVGMQFATRMILTGEPIDAALAEKKGLVAEVVEAARLEESTLQLAAAIAAKPTAVAACAKRALRAADELPLSEGTRWERRLVVEAFDLPDRQEGLAAFLQKRPPLFNRTAGG